jgi:hypothetical protein
MASLALTNVAYFNSVLAESRQQGLTVTASFAEGQSISSAEAIELRLNRLLEKGEGRIGVFIGSSDLTSLFTQVDTRLTYTAKILPLPLGDFVFDKAALVRWSFLGSLASAVPKNIGLVTFVMRSVKLAVSPISRSSIATTSPTCGP